MGVRNIYREGDGSIRLRMNELWNRGEKIQLALVKAESRAGDQERDFPGSLSASVRVVRTLAAHKETSCRN